MTERKLINGCDENCGKTARLHRARHQPNQKNAVEQIPTTYTARLENHTQALNHHWCDGRGKRQIKLKHDNIAPASHSVLCHTSGRENEMKKVR